MQILLCQNESSAVGDMEEILIRTFRNRCDTNQAQECHNIRNGNDSLFKLDAHPPPYFLYLAVASALDVHLLKQSRRLSKTLVCSQHLFT